MAINEKKPAPEPAGEPEGFDLRSVMRAGLGRRGVPQVVLPPMPSMTAPEVLVLGRSPGAPRLADLSNQPKFLIVSGPQNAGKTLDLRVVASELSEAKALGRVVFAPVDHGPRTLAQFVARVEQPDTARQEDNVRFIRDAQDFMVHGGAERPRLFVLDCGGNNTSLPEVARSNPRFVAELEAAGVAVVLGYYWVPRAGDLSLLEYHHTLGLASPHTMLLMNMAKASRGLESFEIMRGQAAWQRAVKAGAFEGILPVLAEEWAQEIENLRLPFWAARDGEVPKGLAVDPLPIPGRVATAEFLAKWRQARAPVASWMA